MVRRTVAVGAGLLMLVALAMLPTAAGAQTDYPPGTPPVSVSPSSVVPPQRPTDTTRPTPPSTRPPSRPSTVPPAVAPEEVVNETPTEQAQAQAKPEVRGDVVSRPLPRTGNDIGGTAIFGGALTVLGVALALGARKRRNSFDGA
jgi:LPXTG-motif cell wall-anchored protein